MSFEIEIPDRVNTWGTAGRTFRPGIWPVDDERVVEAAKRAGFAVREISGDAKSVEFTTERPRGGKPGVLTRGDLAADRNPPTFPCRAGCGQTYKNENNRNKHEAAAHPQWQYEPEPEATPEVKPSFTVVEGTAIEDIDSEADPLAADEDK